MRRALLVALALAAALQAGPAAALGASSKGTSGAQFLKIAPGARPAALGEAFGGLADDVHAAYYNPAGLGALARVELAGMRETRFEGIAYDYAAVSVPLLAWVDSHRPREDFGALAFSVSGLSVDGIERRGTTETDEPIDSFDASDLAYGLAYGLRLPESPWLVGGAMKLVDSRLDSAKARSFALDGGVLYAGERWSAGAGLRNLGTKHRFRSEADSLPLLGYAGASAKLGSEWLAAVELDLPRDGAPGAGLGAEYRKDFGEGLRGALRGGLRTDRRDAGGLGGLSMGLGLGYRNLDFDFAWAPAGDLGNSFRYSLVVKF